MPPKIILILSLSKDALVELPHPMRLPSPTRKSRGEGPGPMPGLVPPP